MADGPPRGASAQAWRPKHPSRGNPERPVAGDPKPTAARGCRQRASGGTAGGGRQRSPTARSPSSGQARPRADTDARSHAGQASRGGGRPMRAPDHAEGWRHATGSPPGERGEAGRRTTLRTARTGWTEQDGRSDFGPMTTSVAWMHHPETGQAASRHRWRGHDGRGNPDGGHAGTRRRPRGHRVQDRAAHERRGQGRTPPRGRRRGSREAVCRQEPVEETGVGRACADRAACLGSWRQLAAAELQEQGSPRAHRARGRGNAAAEPRTRVRSKTSRSNRQACRATARGDEQAVTSARLHTRSKALEGEHRRGGTRPDDVGGRPQASTSRRGPKPGEPHGRMQDATSLRPSRRSKPSRW